MAKQQQAAARWQARARELADWTLQALLNRDDIWAQFLNPSRRREDAQATVVPRPTKRGKVRLTPEALALHYAGARTDQLLAIHGCADGDLSRLLLIDLYTRSQDDASRPGDNFQAALDWAERLQSFGLNPQVLETRGSGGYAILCCFAQPQPTRSLAESANGLVSDFGHRGLFFAPDVFPHWPAEPVDDLRNFIPLPGRHPITDHWTRAWDGDQWLEGDGAIDRLLNLQPSPTWRHAEQAMVPRMEVLEPGGRSEETGSAVYVEHRRRMPEPPTRQPAPGPWVVWRPAPNLSEPAVHWAAVGQPEPVRPPEPSREPAVRHVPPAPAQRAIADPRVILADSAAAAEASRRPRPVGGLATAAASTGARLAPVTPAPALPQATASSTNPRSPLVAEDAADEATPPVEPLGAGLKPPPVSLDQEMASRLLDVLSTLRHLTCPEDAGIVQPPAMRASVAPPLPIPVRSNATAPAIDRELQRVIEAWRELPSAVRAGVMAMVDAAGVGKAR